MAKIPAELVDANQALVLEAVYKNPGLSYTAIERDLKLSEGIIKGWYYRDTHGFRQKYADTLKEAFNRLEGLAVQCMGDLIVNGNFQAAKYVLDNRGYAAPKEIKADVNATQNIVITIGEDEEENE